MRILILNYEYPPIGGGGGVISKYIAELLAGKNHNITVISTWFHSLKEQEELSNLRIIRVRSRRKSTFRSNPLEMLSWIRASKLHLDKMLQDEGFDLTLANFVLPGGEVAYYLKRKYNIPFAVLSHGHDVPWVKPYGKLVPLHAIAYSRLKKICLSSEVNFIQSPEMQENINQFLGPGFHAKNKLIPNGVDSILFSPSKRKFDKLDIIYVGRLVDQKDPLTLLKAVAQFRNTSQDFKLSMYGDGPLRKELEDFVYRHGLSGQVEFFGKVPSGQLAIAYKKSNLMIAPSVSEGMSISILEALSSGVYVLATKVSGNKQLINAGVNGEFIEVGKVKSLLNKINDYFNDKFELQYEVPKDSLDNFRSKFDWNVIVSKYDRELTKVVDL